ncbi:MAG: GAF domain-containing protein, partial [Anaerolineae bacterium]|nr:GAF domain-containing protein [Anaerolineae bacterium]
MSNLPLLRRFLQPNRTWPLRRRLLVLTIVPMVLGLAVVTLLGYERIRTAQQNLVANQQQQTVDNLANRVAFYVQTMPEIVLRLSDSATLNDWLRWNQQLETPLTETERANAALRLDEALTGITREMIDLIQRTSDITQISFIDVEGQEVIRLDQSGRNIQWLALRSNQNNADYFRAASVLDEGEYFISGVTLAEDAGEINTPYLPVVRITTPVYFSGHFAGVVVLGVRADRFLEAIYETAASEQAANQDFVLLDAQGNYLLDTRETTDLTATDYAGHLFGVQRGTGDSVRADEPELAAALWNRDATGFLLDAAIATSQTLDPLPGQTMAGTPWTLIVMEQQSTALAEVHDAGLAFVALAAVILVAMVIGVRQVGNLLTRPLVEAATAADRIAAGDLDQRIPVEREDEIGRLASAVNAMTGRLLVNLSTLEDRFAEQTRDLDVASEIARVAVGIRDLDVLLRRTVNLIRERFDFYHVQVFLIEGQEARLVASTGEAGHKLMQLKWSLPVGSDSVIGRVTASGKEMIALDTEEAAVAHRPNPYLPNTRSEMALPLFIGEEVIGALDIQSVQPNAFSADDVRIFKVLADQVAIAVNNARLLQETERQIERAEQLNRRLTRSAWNEFLGQQADTVQAVYRASTQPESGENLSNRVAAPIRVRGEVIGMLNVMPPPDQSFSTDEITLIDSIAERVSLAVENVRLVSETQQSLQETEQLYQASQAINAATRPEEILAALADNFGTEERSIALNILTHAPGVMAGPPAGFRRLISGAPGLPEVGDMFIPFVAAPTPDMPGFSTRTNVCPTVDAIREMLPPPVADPIVEAGAQALVMLPMTVGDVQVGHLTVLHRHPHRFSERDVEVFGALAGQIATVLRSRQLFEAVETERQTLQSILATMPIGVFVIDAQTRRVTTANEHAVALLGEGTDIFQLAAEQRIIRADDGTPCPEDELPVVRALETGAIAFAENLAILMPNGAQVDVLSNAAPIFGAQGETTGVVTVLQDITELRELQGALQDTLRETTALYESSRAIYAESEIAAIARTILVHLSINLTPTQSFVALTTLRDDLTRETIDIVAALPEVPGGLKGMAHPGGLLDSTASVSIGDVTTASELDDATRAMFEAQGLRAVFSLPLVAARETVGWLLFGYDAPRSLTPEETRILESLADQSAVAMQNARLRLQTEEALNQTMLLYRASREIARAATAQQVLDIFVSFTLPPEASQSYILLMNPQDAASQMRIVATWTRGAGVRHTDTQALESILQQTIDFLPLEQLQQDQPVIVSDFPSLIGQMPGLAEQFATMGNVVPHTVILLPMFVGERMMGFVQINFERPYTQSETALRTYQPLVDQVATAVESQRLLAQTQSSLAETERLYHASQAIRESGSVDEALLVLHSLIMQYDPATLEIHLLDEDRVQQAYNWTRSDVDSAPDEWATFGAGVPVRLDQPPSFIESREALAADAAMRAYAAGDTPVVSLASLPMHLRGEPVGRLVMAFSRPVAFPQTERDYLAAISDQTTIVIDNWRLVQRTQASLDETRVLYETSSALVNATNPAEVLEAIATHALPETVNMAQVMMLVGDDWDSPSAAIEVAAHWSRTQDELSLAGTRFTPDQYPAWAQLTT